MKKITEEKFEGQMKCGKFWISPNELVGLSKDKILIMVMKNIVFCQPDDCRSKKDYIALVKSCAKDIIKALKQ